MKARAVKPQAVEDPDQGDIDALIDLERSPGYLLVAERVNKEIERLRMEMETSHGLDTWLFEQLRGQIKAYRTLLTIPAILKGEIERKVKP